MGKRNKKHYELDQEGNLILNMTIRDDNDFLSVFSESSTPVISSDVALFIENLTEALPVGEALTLRIHSDCIDEQEMLIYKEAIEKYYTEKALVNKWELKHNYIIAGLLAVLGIFVLTMKVFLEYRTGSLIWAEVIDICAWVFLWEAVDISILKNRELRIRCKRYSSYLKMKIEYVTVKMQEH